MTNFTMHLLPWQVVAVEAGNSFQHFSNSYILKINTGTVEQVCNNGITTSETISDSAECNW